MRPVREITDAEVGAREVQFAPNMYTIKRNPVEPEPIGTIVVMAFRVVGYDQDCDGSLMARLEHIDKDGAETGWCPDSIDLYPNTDLVATQDEWRALFGPAEKTS